MLERVILSIGKSEFADVLNTTTWRARISQCSASQVIASLRDLDPAAPYLNPHGGAIALGHPLGMSGARLVMTAVRGLQETRAQRALVTMRVGVGQGLALAVERV
jgi:3-oxoadipyl-CoA thiolase